jgi:hypothetical protein
MCPNSKGQLNDSTNVSSVRKLASTTKFTETENFYASLISTATEFFKASRRRIN